MSDYIEIVAVVEGITEEKFVKSILAPYLGKKNVGMTAIIASKPGQKGGDIRFTRMVNDFALHLKQRKDTYLTMMIDFYGITEWPKYDDARSKITPAAKSGTFLANTNNELKKMLGEYEIERRFIPYVSMHELEALLFSAPHILAEKLGINQNDIEAIIGDIDSPEAINDSVNTAPSKRLEHLSPRYKKTIKGIDIAAAIGIDTMREKCPLFSAWLTIIENQTGVDKSRS
ncbi:MAG: DUF4276 family protein [Thermoguttaceae bacterium]